MGDIKTLNTARSLQRNKRAIEAIRAHGGFKNGNLRKDDLVYLFTDIRHLCESREYDLYEVLDKSYEHYLEDKRIDKEG